MKKTPVIIPFSDIHLESYSNNEKNLILSKINDQLSDLRRDNFNTIVVLAGDIGEGLMGLEWAKKIESDVIYVAGNHEFYSFDYYEVLDKLEAKSKGTNVTFLNNSRKSIFGVNFIGSSLFTSYGDDPDIMAYAQGFMNDYVKIKASKWYSKQNQNKLLKFKQQLRGNSLLADWSQEPFNPLIGREIFDESTKYISKALDVADPNTFNVLVTHHAPFYESMYYINGFLPKNADPKLYYQTKEDLKEFNLSDCQNDLVFKNENILYANCYSSNLSKYVNPELLKKVTLFIHGHIHHPMNYITPYKGMVVTNPKGYKWQQKQLNFAEIITDKSFFHSIFLKAATELTAYIKKSFLTLFAANFADHNQREVVNQIINYIIFTTSRIDGTSNILSNHQQYFIDYAEKLYAESMSGKLSPQDVLNELDELPFCAIKTIY